MAVLAVVPFLPHIPFTRSTVAAAAAALLAGSVAAQVTTVAQAPAEVVEITATASKPAPAVAGWGNVPLARTPLQASVYSAEQLRDAGVQRLSDLVRLDPALTDSYNANGYWDFLTVRGYVLDNRFNYRRDGLPINAETSIPMDNKERIDILKGITGMQAGTSAPGGVANYVVKRPGDAPIRSAYLEWEQPGSVLGSVDLSDRYGATGAFGLRINAAAAHLDPMVNDSKGKRYMLAAAADWRAAPGTLLEAEFETSHQSQPSQAGFSMLGNSVPSVSNPRLNLNNQPWSEPVVFDADTMSLRYTQRLAADWKFIAHGMVQDLKTADRLAFAYGCFDPEPAPDGTYWADRYCPDGTYDLYDYRSENERRRSEALDLSAQGTLTTGTITHTGAAGVLLGRVRNRFDRQAFNYVGTGNVDGTVQTPADPRLTDENTNRYETSTEFYLRDAMALTDAATIWGGLRHTRLNRDSIRTDGSRPTSYDQSFTTPWIAGSYAFAQNQMVYASWGEGVESTVAPNRSRYTNAGEALPALKSKQLELGLKGSTSSLEWSLAAFDIQRPMVVDIGTCDEDDTCTTVIDGIQRHRGVEANAGWRSGPFRLRGGAQWLHARREESAVDADNGLQPTNVPEWTARMQGAYDVGALPGLNLQLGLSYESSRMVTPDNSAQIPGYTLMDAGVRYTRVTEQTRWTWRLGVDNLLDKQAWRESPYQFSHVYLYPIQPRTFRASLEVAL